MSLANDAKNVIEVLTTLEEIFDWVAAIDKEYGFIEKKAKVNIDGIPGKLIWDYILWNDITFETKGKKGKKKQYVLYSGLSDKTAKKKWKKLIKLYGV